MKNANVFLSCVFAGFSLFSLRPARAADHMIDMYYYGPGGYYYYAPSALSVPQGDTVTWVNSDFYPYGGHSATSGSAGSPDGLWDSGLVANEGDTYTLDTSTISPGTYPYFCTVDAYYMAGTLTITAVVNNPPSVSITNPVTGTKFLAPANITLKASASETGGSITNVQFFSGATSLGNVTAAPFNFTANNLAAGNYSFTAKAFDNLGATTNSAAVNIFVLTNSTISSVALLTGGSFQVTLKGIAGQTYAVEASSNLLNWSALFTNVAPANVFNVTDTTSTNVLRRFYRTRQDLN
jgi:plastocyanin